jgi:hypothetical protein
MGLDKHTKWPVDADSPLPQYVPFPRQFRQAAIAYQTAGGVTESLPCGLAPKLKIVEAARSSKSSRRHDIINPRAAASP